jgi:stage II sporulation protein AA (anti-sigma F factor antagonist)
MDDPFSLTTEMCEGSPVIVVRGELDELTSPELEEAIEECPDAGLVLVDLSNVVFISSSGIHALLRDRETPVALVCPPGNVMRLFQIVRASNRVAIYESLDEALQAAPTCAA